MKVSETHSLSIERVASEFETDLQRGLSDHESQSRLQKYGPNELMERPRPGFFKLLFDQFNNFLVIILVVAAAISLVLGEYIDASAIMAIVVLNATLGVVQESKAEQALAALKKMAAPNASVIRNGRQITIPARALIPGDIVVLDTGNYVPADVRLVESVNLKIEEAALTGESVPVNKNAQLVLEADIPLGDRTNSAFMGTIVTYGRGKGLVTATGMQTQIGLIAEMLQTYEDEATPLQLKLDQLGKWLGIIALTICAIIFVIGILRDTGLMVAFTEGIATYLRGNRHEIVELFLVAVSLAIAAVPEGLPAVVTICLALGMQRMIRRHALIRKLPAVETLGCATVICSDKTGTLTQNEMVVVRGWVDKKVFRVTGEGYNPVGEFFYVSDNTDKEQLFDPRTDMMVSFLLHGGLLCNDARLEEGAETEDRAWRIVGDPTEGALITAAGKARLSRLEVEKILPRVMEIPFDSERKRMTTIHQVETSNKQIPASIFGDRPLIAFVKGAPDIVLEYCASFVEDGQVQPLTEEKRQEILAANQDMARQALRVLGVACRPLAKLPAEPSPDIVEKDLVFIGLLGMIDPARPEVKEAVQVAKTAGLKSAMVTGDYRDTAVAIAREIGLLSPQGKVLTGAELDQISDEAFVDIVEQVEVYARVSPQHKVKIVEALKARHHIVAMTGDGVNDAPALQRANIGVAMGITGTDVSKETADMVLTDDNYASIVSAIEVGRVIYANIRKFVFYLLACNVGEILIIFFSMLGGLPIPFRPIHLLWLNLVTDGAPALALGLEEGEADIMKQKPRPTREPVINRDMAISIAAVSLADTVAILSVFLIALSRFPNQLLPAQTMAYTTLVCSELLRAYTSRSEHQSIFSIGIFTNRWMVLATSASMLLMLLVLYVPFLQPFFSTVPLSLGDWLVILPFMFIAPITAEVTKFFLRRKKGQTAAAMVG
ncbi:MAG: cation-translocating P-type ATPase [Anaerolineae bacterium]|nr:cation-translocating P-type ATPase [Anaerolineae bacterium]